MIIAVNTRYLLPGYLEGYGNFLYEVLTRLTKNNPSHQFIFIYDRPFDTKYEWGQNVKQVVVGPPARHPLLWKWWYDYRLPGVLKKFQAELFLSCDGFCSLRTKIPQFLVLHDLAYLHYPEGLKKSHLLFYKKNTPRFISKAARIATVSFFSKKDILENFKTEEEKIDVVYNGVKNIFQPANQSVKMMTREKYTSGKEYFLYTGSIHPRKNLLNLLKAFSIFKKRMQSNLKLVIAGRLAWKYEGFIEKLKSYKYREEVILSGYVGEKELVELMGAAYAFVYPSLWEGFGLPVPEAMRSGIPVITSENSAMEEIAGDAALYVDPTNPASIAEKMMLIYKDENLRKELIAKGNIVQSKYTWDKTAVLLWESIQKLREEKSLKE